MCRYGCVLEADRSKLEDELYKVSVRDCQGPESSVGTASKTKADLPGGAVKTAVTRIVHSGIASL